MLARSHVGWGLAVSLLLHALGVAALTLALPRLNVHPGVIRRVELAIVQDPPPPAASPPLAAAEPSPSRDAELAPVGSAVIDASPVRASADVASGSVAPDNAAPGNAAPGNAAPGNAASGNPAPGKAASVSAAPGNAAPGNAASGNAAPGNAAAPKTPARSKQLLPKRAQPVAATEPKLPSSAHADPRSDGSALERVLRQIAATTELTQDERRRAMLVVLRTWEDPSGKHSADELIEALLKDARAARKTPP